MTDKQKKFFFLADCNNFYVSCERLFNPKLWNKPVVVLSNNDGCVISRSQEAKDLKIPMGAPFHQYADSFRKQGVIACSSNYVLYGDLSSRVFDILRMKAVDVQNYSIDEAFGLLDEQDAELGYLKSICAQVEQWVGIPISIGLGETKTLAKIANHLAKKQKLKACMIKTQRDRDQVLKSFPVEDIWGIGRQLSQFLKGQGMHTAWELANAEDAWIRKNLSVVGLRTAWELRGISCLELDEVIEPRKGIMSSRSFGSYTNNYQEIAEALSSYIVTALEKLRKQNSFASTLTVFLTTNRFNTQQDYYANEAYMTLPEASAYAPLFIQYGKKCLDKIYRPGCIYKKVGVYLGGIISRDSFQKDLFGISEEEQSKQDKIMSVVSGVNQRWGRRSLYFVAEGIKQPWQMKRERLSGPFTTQWEKVLTIKI